MALGVSGYIGATSEEFAAALEEMENSINFGDSVLIQVCAERFPTDEELALMDLDLAISGFHYSTPTARLADGVPTIEFNLKKGSPEWQILIPLIIPLAAIGLLTFGIFKIESITNALVPILLIAGGILIMAVAIAAKPATKYLERGGKIPGLPSAERKLLASTVPTVVPQIEKFSEEFRGRMARWPGYELSEKAMELWKKACEWDKIPTDSKFIIFSDNNPYTKEYNEAAGKLLRFRQMQRGDWKPAVTLKDEDEAKKKAYEFGAIDVRISVPSWAEFTGEDQAENFAEWAKEHGFVEVEVLAGGKKGTFAVRFSSYPIVYTATKERKQGEDDSLFGPPGWLGEGPWEDGLGGWHGPKGQPGEVEKRLREKFPKQWETLHKLGNFDILKVHDDGDLTISIAGKLYVITTDGEWFGQQESLPATQFVQVGERIRYIHPTHKARYGGWPEGTWLEKGVLGAVTKYEPGYPAVRAGGKYFEALPPWAVVRWDFGGDTAIDPEDEGRTWERVKTVACNLPQLVKTNPWREKAEKKLGPEGKKALEELNKIWRDLDEYQIDRAFSSLDLPALKGYLDTLDWLGLEITKPSGAVYPAVDGKMEELQRYFKALVESGFFNSAEPPQYKKMVEIFGEEKAKEMFEPSTKKRIVGNPPSPIVVNGETYRIHMTMATRKEADEEARDLRDHGYKTHVAPWQGIYAIYEGPREKGWDFPVETTIAKKPSRNDVEVEKWEERDRLGIWVNDKRTGKTVMEWWDEGAVEMFEEGFFKREPNFKRSVLEYLEYIGVLEKSGGSSYLPQTAHEEKIEVPFKDAPAWVQSAWKGHHGSAVPRVKVYRTTVARISPPFFEYAVRDIVAHKAGQTMSRYVPSYESLLASSPEEKALYFGGAVQLAPDEAIAVFDYWGDRYKSIELYVHPSAYEPPKLVAPSLTDRQMKILATIRGFTSAYRREMFEVNKVSQAELEELQRMGLIDRRNAITVLGRNVVGNAEPLKNPNLWLSCVKEGKILPALQPYDPLEFAKYVLLNNAFLFEDIPVYSGKGGKNPHDVPDVVWAKAVAELKGKFVKEGNWYKVFARGDVETDPKMRAKPTWPLPAVVPTEPPIPTAKNGMEFVADSAEYLAYTVQDIGYREKLDDAFQTAIARSRGK